MLPCDEERWSCWDAPIPDAATTAARLLRSSSPPPFSVLLHFIKTFFHLNPIETSMHEATPSLMWSWDLQFSPCLLTTMAIARRDGCHDDVYHKKNYATTILFRVSDIASRALGHRLLGLLFS